jgi:hypothetical protein
MKLIGGHPWHMQISPVNFDMKKNIPSKIAGNDTMHQLIGVGETREIIPDKYP